MATNKPLLEQFGLQFLERWELAAKRQTFTFDPRITRDAIDESNILDVLPSSLFSHSLDENQCEGSSFMDIQHQPITHIEILRRDFGGDLTDLKWHIDDVQLVSRKVVYKNAERYYQLTDKHYLYTNDAAIPQWTIVLYFSDYGTDFTGGEFRFVDGTSIKPQKGMGIAFDSREVHMVTPVKTGTRHSLVVKLY
jgi:Rps23 Pro-64 3,4-dihydroxylase Tpa1-like proline 4-hydroxylase